MPAAAGRLDPESYDIDEDDHEEDERGFDAFQRTYDEEHSWEQLQEDEHGRLRPLDVRAEQRAKRRRLLDTAATARIRRGMIRYLQVVLDFSRAASMADMRPSRMVVTANIVQAFIREFFDENPLSQLGLVVMRGGRAHVISELSANPRAHIDKLQASLGADGSASLQNALDLTVASLKSIPPYGHREVLLIFAGLSTCDPGNISDSIKAAKAARVRVSVVGLSAEVHVCAQLTSETGGRYGVALGEGHLQELVMGHAPPPPALADQAGASLVRMGFPQRNAEGAAAAAFLGPDCRLAPGGFTCPRCRARVAELPSSCHVCGLTLVSSPHLARSYHHLFPVTPFDEVPPDALAGQRGSGGRQAASELPWPEAPVEPFCFGCLQPLKADQSAADEAGVVVACRDCKHLFCFECDTYIHETLHNCPGCECLPAAAEAAAEDAAAEDAMQTD